MTNASTTPFLPDYAALAEFFSTPFNGSRRPPRVAVVGDYCLDKYLYVYPALEEASVETGLPAYQIRGKRLFAGVGGTIANNLRALGAETFCFGVIGEDGEGFDLLQALRRIGANVEGMVVSPEVLTGTYMKPMFLREAPVVQGRLATPEEGSWEEGNRLDIRNPQPVDPKLVDELKRRFLAALPSFDAVVVSDQFPAGSEALFSTEFRQFVSGTAAATPNVFFLCDSRFFIDDYRGALVKCNADEALDAYDAANAGGSRRETTVRQDGDADENAVLAAGRWLAARNRRPVLITRGSRGSLLFEAAAPENQEPVLRIPSVKVEPPIDICGAGDATNAGFAFARALGLPLASAAFIAGVVSSITIKQIGVTGTASPAEITSTLRRLAVNS